MVIVVKTPSGHKIIDQSITAEIISSFPIDSGNSAVVHFDNHSLSNGDVVYITSDIEEYNGFLTIEVIDFNNFYILDTDYIEFYQAIDIEYYQTQPHDWSSIFLPIVYKASNNRWPVNSVDAVGLIVLNSDDNGFTTLTTAAPIAGLNAALEFVKITGATDDANGVWQVVEIIASNVVTINLPYEFSGNLIGKAVQYYYNNYQVRVKVFAGLNATHPWEARKPYEEMAELSLTPDENNEVMFSVSDYIKSKVAIKNNLTLFSLPLNLDAFTGFYISVGESYDDSDGYSLFTNESTFADDDFEGYAIAGKLPFKNVYAGDYADYVYTSGSPARWLTNWDRLLAVEDYYFDVSFIKNIIGTFNLIIDKYVSDYLTQTEVIPYSDQGIGVYRLPITVNTLYDSFCVRVRTDTHEEEVLIPPTPFDLSEFVNNDDEGVSDWVLGDEPFGSGTNMNVLYVSYPTTMGTPYKFNYRFVSDNVSPGTHNVAIATLDAAVSGISFALIPVAANGVYEGFVNITPSADGLYFGINFTGSSPMDVTLEMLSEGDPTTEIITIDGETITEEVCIDILDTCEAAEGFTEEDRRLLEDGDYRLLE
jgi:hypothetical protein